MMDIGKDLQNAYEEGYEQGRYDERVETEMSLPKWIPVSEKPKDSQEVIVSVYWTDYGDTILAYGHYNARFDTWKLYSDLEGELIKGYEVVAWMPMPHPYTADRKAE